MRSYVFNICKKKTVQKREGRFMFNEWEGQASGPIGLSNALGRYFDAIVLRAIWVVFVPQSFDE